jgi:cytochrome c biogenesis protein CcdA
VYTRVLSLRAGLSAAGRLAYLGLYGAAYVVPLAAIVAAFALTLRRVTLTERTARALKGVSGALLVLSGLVFLLWPGLLG